MNMKRIVFVAVGILIMLAIMGFTLYSMSHIDEINERRREKEKGEAIASRMATTVATTSIWDALRQTEPQTEYATQAQDNVPGDTVPEMTDGMQEGMQEAGDMPQPEEQGNQTITETVMDVSGAEMN